MEINKSKKTADPALHSENHGKTVATPCSETNPHPKAAFEKVILVNEQDQPIGVEEKIRAHELGLLHRAFSVFIYRRNKHDRPHKDQTLEFLLQKRHHAKYHCGGLWTNTCCSHPRENESVLTGAERRLKEEMSLDINLKQVGSFIYKASFSNGLTEYEFDHVLIGEYLEDNNQDNSKVNKTSLETHSHIKNDNRIVIHPEEVEEYCWISLDRLQKALNDTPALYTPWIKPALKIALEGIEQ